MTAPNEAALRRRLWITGGFLLGLHAAIGAACAPALAQSPARSTGPGSGAQGGTGPGSAIARMQARGPEGEELASRTGRWDVVITLRLTPDAKPIVTRGVIADRSMVGNYLEEVMKPAPGSRTPDFRRIAYLTYNRVEGRWQYVSLDTRFPVGIMPARSFEKPVGGKLVLEFDTLAFVGFGPEVEGRMVQSNFVIDRSRVDHEIGQQYWTQADGTGQRWLAVQYEYTRRR